MTEEQLSSLDGKFTVGDTVQPDLQDGKQIASFVVKDIYNDAFGSVLLAEVGGRGYGSQYCEKVE